MEFPLIMLLKTSCTFLILFHYMSLHRILQPGNFAEMVCGTSFYMAPEILQFQRYNEKVGTLLPIIKFLLAVIIAL